MSVEKVREYFKKYNIEDRIQEFEESSATVELAAKALKCEPAKIAKTLSQNYIMQILFFVYVTLMKMNHIIILILIYRKKKIVL